MCIEYGLSTHGKMDKLKSELDIVINNTPKVLLWYNSQSNSVLSIAKEIHNKRTPSKIIFF